MKAQQQQQQKSKQEQAEQEREERARRWRHGQEETAKAKEKLDKENPPKKSKPKLKPKKLGDRVSDNVKDKFGIGKDAPFDMHKVPFNLYETGIKIVGGGLAGYLEHQHEQEKIYRWAKKGYGPQNKTWGDILMGKTEEDGPWKVCEHDKWKLAGEGLKKAGGNFITGLLITKNPYVAGLSGAYGGIEGILDEKEKQDVKIHECEQNKKPKL